MVWFWKYGRRRRAAWTKDRASFSTIWYLVSGSCSVLLTKYTGCCVPSTSWTRAALTVWSVAVIYTSRGWLMFGLWRMGGEVRVVLSFWKICSQSSVHVNRADFFRSWIMG